MSQSTAPAAQQAFVELLQAAEAFDDAAVMFAGTGKLPKTEEIVWVLPVRSYERVPGEQLTIERFDLAVRFEVFRAGEFAGGDADTARWALIDAADTELKRTDFHGYYSKGGDLAVEEHSLALYDKGWVAESIVTFACEVWMR